MRVRQHWRSLSPRQAGLLQRRVLRHPDRPVPLRRLRQQVRMLRGMLPGHVWVRRPRRQLPDHRGSMLLRPRRAGRMVRSRLSRWGRLYLNTALLIARVLLALVFASAGVAKLADRSGSRQALIDFGLPRSLAAPLGILLPLAELEVAAALIPVATAWWGAMGALALLLAFVGGIQQRSKASSRLCSRTRLAAITFWQDEYYMLVQPL